MLKKTTLFLLAAMLCLLAACPSLAEFDVSQAGLTVSGKAQQLGKPQSYGSAKVTVSVPDENAAQDGVNPITGESWQGSYQPVLVNIDSHPRALPHWGVASADLIYEMPIQVDGSTRQLALFMGEYPEMAGPVRSARIPMASLREMWGGPYYFFGYQAGTTSVKKWVQQNSETGKFSYPYVELMNKKKGQWYNRTNDGNHVAPYNVTLIMSKVQDEYAVTPEMHPFIFTETGLTRGEDAAGVIISYKATTPAYLTAYQYNEATGMYDRYRNGTPYTDAITGEATSFANVLVVRTDVSFKNNNPSRPVIRLNGQGVCEIFQNGKYIRGTWVRDCTETDNLDSRMVFLDENGEELPMKAGKTFIQIVDNEQPVIVVSEGQIEGSVEPQEQRLIIGDGKTTTKSSSKSTQVKKPKATATPTPTPEPTATPTAEPTATPEVTEEPADEPEQIEPETKPEESAPEQSEPENKPEESAPEQTEPENKPEESAPEQAEPENKPEESAPEQAEPEQRPEESAPEQAEPEQKPEESAPEQAEPETKPEQSTPEQSAPAQSEPEQKPDASAPEQAEAASNPPAEAAPAESVPAEGEQA